MTEPSKTLQEQIGRVRWIVLDVDGVMTDGKLVIDSAGGEIRSFSVRDGLGIKIAQHAGIGFAIISGRDSPVVKSRAIELHIDEIHLGVHRKADCLREILERRQIEPAAACYIGDDVIDIPAMRLAGLGVAPSDADPAARAEADFVTETAGGHGVVREMVDMILQRRGEWDQTIASMFPH
ncbi:MAG: HAD hydrolase family protein [Acidobacteriota bacterium]|nr:HAD hydrolase family protein [Acidobacteriota bacterium]